MINNTPSGTRKHRESTKPGTRKTGQMFFFFLLLNVERVFFRESQVCLHISRVTFDAKVQRHAVD